MSLDEIRSKIDSIDRELIPLFKKRMECSLEVARIKSRENLPIYHPGRENEILNRVAETAGEEYGAYISSIYRSMLAASRSLQSNTLYENSDFAKSLHALPTEADYSRVICQGAEGAFSHAAAKKMFPGKNPEFLMSFEDVFKAVEQDENAVGVLPVENSTAGSVNPVYDLILKYKHCIVKATAIDVAQNLLTVGSADKVKTVYSHPHAIKQCEKYIASHKLEAISFENTALAAKFVAENNNPEIAAIGSAEAASLYGLTVAVKAIQDEPDNITRFIAVSKKPFIAPNSNTVSLAFTIPHETGSLYSMLGRFADCGLNLTKIESRPSGHGFEYKFYIDFSGNINDEHTVNLLSSLKSELSYFVFLGNYAEC